MSEHQKSSPRYSEIALTLREEVLAGRYGTDGRMPSESQLVKRFGVSRPTIAKALRVLSDEALIERRSGSGSFAKTGGKETAKSNWLALLIPDLGNTEIFQVIGGEIASLARTHNYGLVWGGSGQPKSDPGQTQLQELCRQFIERNVAGVFFAPYELVEDSEAVNQSMAQMLREAGIPVVLLDRDIVRFPKRSDFDLVGVDNFAGGFLLAEHLIKLGCRKIHFVVRPRSASTVDARIAGVREAFARYRIDPDPNWIRIGLLDDKKFMRSIAGPIVPEAFICANDHTAALLMLELQRNHVRIPDQVRVVGFDDVKFATLVSPSLTTIRQPCREIAQTAFQTLIDRLGDATLPARKQELTPRLAIRDSCGAYLPRSGK